MFFPCKRGFPFSTFKFAARTLLFLIALSFVLDDAARRYSAVPLSKESCAVITYLSSADYLECASTLAFSIKRWTHYPFIVALTDDFDHDSRVYVRERLHHEHVQVISIPTFKNPNPRPTNKHFKNNYAVLSLWNQTGFKRIVAVDADMVALDAIDELCEMHLPPGHIAAANNWWTRDRDWDKNLFNGGLMVLEPDKRSFDALVSEAADFPSASGGVQPFLNHFFNSTWVRLDPKKWGMNANAFDLRPKDWNGRNIKLLHFTTKAKPCHTSPGEFIQRPPHHPYVLWHNIHRRYIESEERQRRKTWKSTLPESERTACILYLLTKESGPTGKNYIDLLQRSIVSLEKHFFPFARYPICVLHTADVDHKELFTLTSLTKSTIHAYEVRFRFPLHKQALYSSTKPTAPSCVSKFNPNEVWHINYLHMCHFYTYDVFFHPVFKDFDWIFRLDADSGLTTDIPCDPFDVLEKNRKVFGYYKKEKQGGGCADGFHDLVMREYLQKYGGVLKHAVEPNDVYLGAFHVFKTSFFRSPELLEFWSWIDHTSVAYENRTGEQAVIPYALALTAERDRLHQFAGYGLWHRHEANKLWPERLHLPSGC